MKNNNALKKGHLYFHTKLARVERIVTINGKTIEHRHHNVSSVSDANSFRLATRDEVMAYLGK